jgi:hypothetical protein
MAIVSSQLVEGAVLGSLVIPEALEGRNPQPARRRDLAILDRSDELGLDPVGVS